MFMYFGRASRIPKKSRVALGRGQGKLLASVSSLSLSPSPWTPASCEVAAFECEKGVTNLPCANLAEILSGPTGRLLKPLTSNWTQLGWKIFFCFVLLISVLAMPGGPLVTSTAQTQNNLTLPRFAERTAGRVGFSFSCTDVVPVDGRPLTRPCLCFAVTKRWKLSLP